MSLQVIEAAIHQLHLKVITATGFHKENATPQYLQTVCRAATLLERDLIEYALRGNIIQERIKSQVAELRQFACN